VHDRRACTISRDTPPPGGYVYDLKYFDPHRRSTWLELFFDLIFVVAMGDVTHLLSHTHNGHLDPAEFRKFVLVFIPLWWTWASHTLYANRFDSDSRPHRLATLCIMFLVLVISGFISDRYEYGYPAAVICYFLAQLIIAGMYFHSGYQRHHHTEVASRLAASFLIGACISLASTLFVGPGRYVVFNLGIVFDLGALIWLRHSLAKIPVHTDHMLERVGSLSLILLGEAVISLAAGLENNIWTPRSLITAATGFVLVSSIWWVFFDSFNLLSEQKLTTGHSILYSQLFLFLGLSILAILIRHAILEDMNLTDFRVLGAIGMSLFFLGKQYPYFMERPELRRFLVTNTLAVAILTGLTLLLPSIRYILMGLTATMIVYTLLNYRYR
jgi:low temperature requirement protein LtrA